MGPIGPMGGKFRGRLGRGPGGTSPRNEVKRRQTGRISVGLSSSPPVYWPISASSALDASTRQRLHSLSDASLRFANPHPLNWRRNHLHRHSSTIPSSSSGSSFGHGGAKPSRHHCQPARMELAFGLEMRHFQNYSSAPNGRFDFHATKYSSWCVR